MTVHQDGLVVSVSASHVVGHAFVSRQGHTKYHHRKGTNCLPDWHTDVRVGVWQPNRVKGWVLCRTVYWDMHF